MISMGDEGVTPRQRASQLTAGLGLLRGVVVDQHFDQRSRYGRLHVGHRPVAAPARHRHRRGHRRSSSRDRREFTVRGAGAVFVLDCRTARTDAADARAGAPCSSRARRCTRCPQGLRSTSRSDASPDFVEQHPDVLVSIAAAKA